MNTDIVYELQNILSLYKTPR